MNNTEYENVNVQKESAVKKGSLKYIVGGCMCGFGLFLVIISAFMGGWGMLKNFDGINIDWDGVHYYYYDEEHLYSGVTKMETEKVKNLDIDVDYGELVIKTADVEAIEISTKNVTEKRFNCKLSNDDTLKITYGGGFSFFTWRANSVITITIPINKDFDKVEIRNGAGSSKIDGINAKEMKADNGAGELKFTDINVENQLKVETGAGAVTMNSIICEDLKISSGVGEINAKDTICAGIDIDNGIGAFSYSGEINGDAKIENGIGEVKMNIKGNSSDYSFKVDSGIGQVKVNGNSPIQYDGAKYKFKVDTGIGEVKINFE